MFKNFLIFTVLLVGFLNPAFSADSQQGEIKAPIEPVSTCQTQDYRCLQAFNDKYMQYRRDLNSYNNYRSSLGNYAGHEQAVSSNGSIQAPTAPTNNCGSPPAAGTNNFQYNSCDTKFQVEYANYQKVQASYDQANQLLQQNQASYDEQRRKQEEQTRLGTQTATTVTGQLGEVNAKSSSSSKGYAVVSSALAGYAVYKMVEGTTWQGSCGPWSPASCAYALAAFGAAAILTMQSKKANNQSRYLANNATDVCKMNNELSSSQQNCGYTDPGSPVVWPEIANSPDVSWYNADGSCKSGSPATCTKIQNKTGEFAGTLGKSPPKGPGCPGGGNSCLAGINPIVVETPKGTKVTFKVKDKEYSYFESDFKDENSMIAAGFSPAAAKLLKKELDSQNSLLAQSSLDAKKEIKNLKEADFGSFNSKLSNGGGSSDPLSGAAAGNLNRKFEKENLASVESRKPSAAGYSKDFFGDLIGASGDDIFSMMNRRYQLKNEQDSFIGP